MSEERSTNPLHLPSLSIRSFRGIESLSIPRLGRVTLIAGMNGTGKTTVLDAIRIYAARGSRSALFELPQRREEVAVRTDEDGDTILEPDLASVFHEGDISRHGRISIGLADGVDQLEIDVVPPGDESFERIAASLPETIDDRDIMILRVKFRGAVRLLPPVQFPRKLRRLGMVHDNDDFPPRDKARVPRAGTARQ